MRDINANPEMDNFLFFFGLFFGWIWIIFLNFFWNLFLDGF